MHIFFVCILTCRCPEWNAHSFTFRNGNVPTEFDVLRKLQSDPKDILNCPLNYHCWQTHKRTFVRTYSASSQ